MCVHSGACLAARLLGRFRAATLPAPRGNTKMHERPRCSAVVLQYVYTVYYSTCTQCTTVHCLLFDDNKHRHAVRQEWAPLPLRLSILLPQRQKCLRCGRNLLLGCFPYVYVQRE